MFRSTHACLVRPAACCVADSLSCSVLCDKHKLFTAGLPNIADPTWPSPELICQRRSVEGRCWEYAAPFSISRRASQRPSGASLALSGFAPVSPFDGVGLK